ncbi:MAG: CopG family transcriptional regulator [Paramuribaculum sp.]|nr:CopG family transcriptional regulator [Paramuribaculum sp.]
MVSVQMEKIKVEIYWEDKNYCCGWSCEGFGAVICTNKNIENLKIEFEEALKSQVKDMVSDGEYVPQWLAEEKYIFEYTLAVSALLRQAERVTTMAVISRVTGINQKLLSNYASSIKIPRDAQRERIVDGLHTIGRQLLSVQ